MALDGLADDSGAEVVAFCRSRGDARCALRGLPNDEPTFAELPRLLAGRDRVLQATGRTPRLLLEFERNILVLDLEGPFPPGIRPRDELRRAFEAAWARLQTEEPGEPVDGLDQRFQDALLSSLRWHKAM